MGDFVATFRTLPGDSIDAYLSGYDRDARSAVAGHMSASRDETTH